MVFACSELLTFFKISRYATGGVPVNKSQVFFGGEDPFFTMRSGLSPKNHYELKLHENFNYDQDLTTQHNCANSLEGVQPSLCRVPF